MQQSKATLEIVQVPSLLRLRWVWLLTKTGYTPKVTVTTVPDAQGRILKISYRVFYTFWMGEFTRRAFYGFPVAVYTADGDCLAKGKCWNRVACDQVECNTTTDRGHIEFHPSNPSY